MAVLEIHKDLIFSVKSPSVTSLVSSSKQREHLSESTLVTTAEAVLSKDSSNSSSRSILKSPSGYTSAHALAKPAAAAQRTAAELSRRDGVLWIA
jgi:hypothetical protein